MARTGFLKHIRKAGAFIAGELLAGEIGVNTAGRNLAFSPDGSSIIKVAPFVSTPFYAAGSYPVLFPVAVTIPNPPTVQASNGGSPTVTYQRSTALSGSRTTINTWPQSFPAGDVLWANVTTMAGASIVVVSAPLQ